MQILEVPDGSLGAFGQILPTADILRMVVDAEHRNRIVSRHSIDEAETHAQRGTVTVVDPICGMSVALAPDALTLDIDGTTYGFCSERCRDLFRQQVAAQA